MQRFRRYFRPLAALLGVTGATVAVNRGLRERSAIPINHLGGLQRSWRWRGHEMFATELGAGAPVLLVHGIYAGASSYEFRKIVAPLAATRRVVAFDFLGCGLSAMPAVEYTPERCVDQIVDAL